MPTPLAGYAPYKNLPPLAGLCTLEEAAKPGLSVEECVRRLKRFHYCFKRLHQILTARITAEPIYELKTAFAHHAYLCAEHATALRTRIGEMREPPLGLEEVPHPALEVFFDEILCAPTTEALVCGVYVVAVADLLEAIRNYRDDTNPLTDAPSRRILRFALLELEDMDVFGRQAFPLFVGHEWRNESAGWHELLLDLVSTAGGVDGAREPRASGRASPTPPAPLPEGRGERRLAALGEQEPSELGDVRGARTSVSPLPFREGGPGGVGHAAPEASPSLPRRYSAAPYVYDPIPRRDERFADPWNQGVNAESFLYDETKPARAKALMMLYKRLREIDVPEMMASIITRTPGKPWGYYRDMSRQLWDEARHAMMGEVGFVALGVDWTKARITFNWSYRLNTECTPDEAHGVLFFIEQGLMPRTGKRYEFEVAQESGIPLMATLQDFDWADEVLHAQIGRSWYVPKFASLREALDYGDAAWSKVLSNWATVKERGLTEHANWWPAVYAMACAADGAQPDATVLAFAESYEGKRADLKSVGEGQSG